MKVFNLKIKIQKQFYDSNPSQKQPTQPHMVSVTLTPFVDIKMENASYRHAQKMNAFNLHKRNLKLFSGPTLTPKQLNIAQTGRTNLKLKLTLCSKLKPPTWTIMKATKQRKTEKTTVVFFYIYSLFYFDLFFGSTTLLF